MNATDLLLDLRPPLEELPADDAMLERILRAGLARAVAALNQPDVLLHFKVTTTDSQGDAIETTETWQTPDGRRKRTIYSSGIETAYDQKAHIFETYVPERKEVIAQTEST